MPEGVRKHNENDLREAKLDLQREGHRKRSDRRLYLLYVTRHGTIGPQPENNKVELDPEITDEHQLTGTLEDCNRTVGRWCRDNSRLVLHVCIALASLVMSRSDERTTLFHFVSRRTEELEYCAYDPSLRSSGQSRTGKSTALYVACCVTGTKFETWLSTRNALEEIAEWNHDSLTALDEIANAEKEDLAKAGYMLYQGRGKARMGQRRKQKQWSTLIISNGEITFEEKLAESGVKMTPGLETRCINIMSILKYGMFDTIHELVHPAAFAKELEKCAKRNQGVWMRALLEQLTIIRIFGRISMRSRNASRRKRL